LTRRERADRIRTILEELYPETAIPLSHRDAYTLLIAVLLSAQTTDKKVNEVTPALFDRAATPAAMAELSVEQIHRFIREIGLANQKAKAIRRLSEILVDEHDGAVPRTFEALEALPGVGHKTASVVMTQAFGLPAFPVDTHIHRLAWRWSLSDGSSVTKTERDLKKVFPEETWGKVHLQVIYFGREHCPSRNHDFEACPICSWACPKSRREQERRAERDGEKKPFQ